AEDSVNLRGKASEFIIAMGLGDRNLLERLRDCQKQGEQGIPPVELLNYMEDSAKAIDYLNQPTHDLGSGPVAIQHCDIKPQNILLVGGAVQVCDFGLARVLQDVRVSSAVGSAAYMAPEVLRDGAPSSTTDQYSLAISYIELRTGSLPFDSHGPASIIQAHLMGQLNLSRLSPEEQQVIRRATALDPAKRYPTTLDMVRALRRALEGGATSHGQVSVPTKPFSLAERMQPGKELVPGYKLIRLLGEGGYGEVWEAAAPGGRRVALKVIPNMEAVQGKQEFKALELIKGVDHNNLMELHAYWLLDSFGNVIPDEIRHRPDTPPASI